MVNKYIFIKDENYKSSLFNNSIEYLYNKKLLLNESAGSIPYKIKFTSEEDAYNIIHNYPINFKKIGNGNCALISFGGTINFINIDELIKEVDKTGFLVYGATPPSNYSEEKTLANAKILKMPFTNSIGFTFIYFVIIKIENTPIYYFILNDALVQSISNFDQIIDTIHFQQLKAHTNSLRDCIFALNWERDNIIIYPEQTTISFFDNTLIQTEEEKKEIFKTLSLDIDAVNCSYKIENYSIKICDVSGDTGIIKIKILNNLFLDKIIPEEKLEWTFIIVKNNCQS